MTLDDVATLFMLQSQVGISASQAALTNFWKQTSPSNQLSLLRPGKLETVLYVCLFSMLEEFEIR